MIARRRFLQAAAIAATTATIEVVSSGSGRSQSRSSAQFLAKVDHLVYATPNLNLGIEKLENLLGVRMTPGGQHPGRGTRNAILSLGDSTYIEVLGPDLDQPPPQRPRWFGIDTLPAPRLVGWAAKGVNLERLVSDAAQQGIRLGAVGSGSRTRPDGIVLTWQFTDPFTVVADGIVPFFIDWGQTPHPALSGTRGLTLVDLRAEHPDSMPVQRMLNQLGFDLPVQRESAPQLIATITGPRGRVELR
jgi:hypothetical protein